MAKTPGKMEPEGRVTSKTEEPEDQDERVEESKRVKGTHPVTGEPLEPGQDPPNLQSGTTYQAIASPEGQAAGEPPPPPPDPVTDPAGIPQKVEGADYRATPGYLMPPGPMTRQKPPFPNQPGTPPFPPEGGRTGGDPHANPMNPPGYQPGGQPNQSGWPPISGDPPIGQGPDTAQTVGQPTKPQHPSPTTEPVPEPGKPQPGGVQPKPEVEPSEPEAEPDDDDDGGLPGRRRRGRP